MKLNRRNMEIVKFDFGTYMLPIQNLTTGLITTEKALTTINEIVARRFQEKIHNLLSASDPLDKCKSCAWFHRETKFCAVAPQNLINFECTDHQVFDVHLQSLNPEYDNLLEQTTQTIDINTTELRNKLQNGWYDDRNCFDEATLNVLWAIESAGNYSITKMELMSDAIRVKSNTKLSTEDTAKHILYLISINRPFAYIMRWILFGV
jgi:hypothetical protein